MTQGLINLRASQKREARSTLPSIKPSGFWRCGDYLLNYRRRPLVMGVLNVTPDSFSDGGLFLKGTKAIDHGLRLEEEGADVIDIGGESTRPGALPVSFDEESQRVLPTVNTLAKKLKIPLSIDTRNSEIAKRAIEAGVSIINDVSGFSHDPKMFLMAAKGKTGLVFMHSKGSPETMQKSPRYRNLIDDIYYFLKKQIDRAIESNISKNRIAIDPGIGFGKTPKHNLTIIHRLNHLTGLGVPVLVGPSRKSFIGKILDLPPIERQEGTAASVAISVFQGARILRVHDVKSIRRVVLVAEGIKKETVN